jgi:hypothetical protein
MTSGLDTNVLPLQRGAATATSLWNDSADPSELKEWTSKRRILTTPGVLDWPGVATLKHAHRVFTERGFRSHILSAALRAHTAG